MTKTPGAAAQIVQTGSVTTEEQARRFNLFRIIAWLSFTAFTVFLAGYIIGWLLLPDFPVLLIWADVLAVLLTVAVLWLLSRGIYWPAVGLYVAGVTMVLFVAIYFINGVTGPIVLALPLIALIAGELGGRSMGIGTAVTHIVLYVILAGLEAFGVVIPFQMPILVSRIVWIGIFITGTAVTVAVNQQFVRFMQMALAASQQREQALTEANLRAQEAAEAERVVQEQAIATAQQLQETVRVYSSFLERITQGDYQASLDLEALIRQENLSPELIDLGGYLNATVSSLVTALGEARLAQQRYVEQSWDALTESSEVPVGYRYRAAGDDAGPQADVETAANVWLDPMADAIRQKTVKVDAETLAVPMTIGGRDQVIGALGLRRDGSTTWGEDELAMITAVTDQLAQTIENLRLIDDTTRRAVRERKASEITAHIREAVEIEAVLERALGELGQALAAERGIAYLALGDQKENSV